MKVIERDAFTLTYGQFERPVFEGRLRRAEDDRVPLHYVVITRGPAHSRRWVLLKKQETVLL